MSSKNDCSHGTTRRHSNGGNPQCLNRNVDLFLKVGSWKNDWKSDLYHRLVSSKVEKSSQNTMFDVHQTQTKICSHWTDVVSSFRALYDLLWPMLEVYELTLQCFDWQSNCKRSRFNDLKHTTIIQNNLCATSARYKDNTSGADSSDCCECELTVYHYLPLASYLASLHQDFKHTWFGTPKIPEYLKIPIQ